jgi:hypothetical protein
LGPQLGRRAVSVRLLICRVVGPDLNTKWRCNFMCRTLPTNRCRLDAVLPKVRVCSTSTSLRRPPRRS